MRGVLATRIAIAALCALPLLGAAARVAEAAFTAAGVVTQQPLGTLLLAAPSTAAATTSNGCSTVALVWSAAPGATAYRIEVQVAGGAWTPLTTVAAVTAHTDTTAGRQGTTVTYRVFARHAASGWESANPAVTTALACGIQTVTDLAVTNPCSSTALTWSAPAGTNRYDVQRRVNGGAWTVLVNDQAATTYTDATVHVANAVVEYQVRSGVNTTNGLWSASRSVASWQPFRVVSVSIGNSGVLGTLNAGDTITVNFSKPVARTSVAGSVAVDHAGGDRGLYLGTGTVGTGGIGRILPATATFGATVTYAGNVTWSNADATWTWSPTAGGTTMSAALGASDTFTAGTGARCAADGTSALLTSPAPTTSGRW